MRRLHDSDGAFPFRGRAKIFRERFHGGRKPFGCRLRGRVVYRAEGPELDFALSRLNDFLLVTARDDVRKEISVRVDQETLDDITTIGSALESFSRSENAKIRRHIDSQELLVRTRSAPGKNTVGRLPERERRFVGNFRLRFIYRPGSDLYFVVNEERGEPADPRALLSRGVALKLSYVARF